MAGEVEDLRRCFTKVGNLAYTFASARTGSYVGRSTVRNVGQLVRVIVSGCRTSFAVSWTQTPRPKAGRLLFRTFRFDSILALTSWQAPLESARHKMQSHILRLTQHVVVIRNLSTDLCTLIKLNGVMCGFRIAPTY